MRSASLGLSLLLLAPGAQAAGFTLRSADIPSGDVIPLAQVYDGFGCTGANVSPALSWSEPPAGTRSFALLVHDPDAPTGGTGLPPGARQIRTDYGTAGWGGPCPPQGDKAHRYVFTLHALKVEKLAVPAEATAALAGYVVNANSLGTASFTGTFGCSR